MTDKQNKNNETVSTPSRRTTLTPRFAYVSDFCGDFATRKYRGSKYLAELLPMLNGCMLPFEEWVCPDDLPSLTQQFDDLFAKRLDEIEQVFRTDYFGIPRYYRIQARKVDDTKNTVEGIIQDVTESFTKRKVRESDLEFWRVSFDSIPAVFFVKDADDDFRYVFANHAFCQFTGKRRDEIIGKTDPEIRPEWGVYPKEDIDTLHNDSATFFENEAISADGQIKCFRTMKWHSVGANGHILIHGIGLDVTSQQLAAADMKIANDCVPVFSNINSIKTSLRNIMELLCGHLGASRGFVVSFDQTKMTAHCVQEYVAPNQGVDLFLYGKDVPFSDKEEWFQSLEKEHFFAILDSSDPKAVGMLGYHGSRLRAAGSKAIYTAAILDLTSNKPKLIGAICFGYNDASRRLTAERTAYLLSFAARLIQNVWCYESQQKRVNELLKAEQNTNLALQVAMNDESIIRYCLETMLNETNPSKAAQKCLKRTCERLVAPHGFLFDVHLDSKTIELRQEYSKDGQPTLIEGKEYSYIIQPSGGDENHCDAILSLPKRGRSLQAECASSPWKEIIAKNNWSALYGHIILLDGRPHGFFMVAYEKMQRVLGESSLRFLNTMAHCFEHLLERRRIMEVVLDNANQEILTDSENLDVTNDQNRLVNPVRKPLHDQDLGLDDISRMIRNEHITSNVLAAVVTQHDFKTVVNDITATLLQLIGCDRVMLVLMQGDKPDLFHEKFSKDASCIQEADMEYHQRLWTSLVERLKVETFVSCDDLHRSPDAKRVYEELPNSAMRSFAVRAIWVNGEFVGFLNCVSYHQSRFRESDAVLMQSMCNIIALAMIRERQDKAIQTEKEENQAILDNISIPLWLFDRNGIVIRSNKASAPMVTPDPFRHTSGPCHERTHCGKDDATCPVRCALRTRQQVQADAASNGRNFIITASPILDADGQVAQLVESLVDVTELHEREKDEKLMNRCLASVMPGADQEKAFRVIIQLLCEHFHSDRCYILRFDTENKQVYHSVEYCADGIKPVLSKLPPQPLNQNEQWFQRLQEHKWIDYNVEEELKINNKIDDWGIWADFICKVGVKRFYSVPIYLNDKLWGNWGMTYERENVTLNKRSRNLITSIGKMLELVLFRQQYIVGLTEAKNRAEEATQAKSIFLSTMSHELRTPLNSVIGYSDLLSDTEVSPQEIVEYASGINHSSNVLVNLINDLLDFSKLEANQMQIVTGPTDLHLMFHELSAVFQLSASAKGVLLRFHIRPEMPLLYLDELRIRQILMNLIGNAVKYTPNGSIDVTAEYDANHTLSLVVADTGLGVEPTAQKIIFEPFTQQDAVRDTKIFKGTGLGLAIVKTLAEKMGGHIGLQSEVDKGSVFSVVIPKVELFTDSAPMTAGDEYSVDTSLKILLVDDVPMNINLFEKMLAKLNITDVHKAYSAAEALAILEENPVDLIFTDMLMPEVDGLELAERIRANKKYDTIDIYLVTADVDARISAAESYFSGVLLKPITLKDIKKAVSVKRKTNDK